MLLSEEPAVVSSPLPLSPPLLILTNPPKLISHTINNFNIQPDKLAVARVQESLSTLKQARDLRIAEAESSLRKLSRQLGAQTSRHDDVVEAHASADHASNIARLDTLKFRTAKAASDAENDAQRLALQAADLAARLQELELQGVEGGGTRWGGGGGIRWTMRCCCG